MTEEIFKKLQCSVNEMELSVRAAHVFNNTNVTHLIGIYVEQERRGGYRKKGKVGLLQLRNFGKGTLAEIDYRLEEFGLPPLREGHTVVREFFEFPFLAAVGYPGEDAGKKAKRFFQSIRCQCGHDVIDDIFRE